MVYILSIILILYFFSPFKEDKRLDLSGNTLEYIVNDNKLVIFFFIAITGFISLLLFLSYKYLPKHFLSELSKDIININIVFFLD